MLSFDYELDGFQIIVENVHFFWQVVGKYSCKISKQKMVVHFLYEEPVHTRTLRS